MPHRSLALVVLLLSLAGAVRGEPPARRVVSLNPSLTETLVALDALTVLVGVDDYSARVQPEVRGLPRVGGLFNPSLEAIVGLEPDLVALVPSAQQRNLRERLLGLGIEVLVLENITLAEVLTSIEVLGARVGRAAAARERVEAIRSAWRASERAFQARAKPRAVLVLQRDPLYLVGRGSFLDDMLAAAGAHNLASEAFAEPYPRVAIEWLLSAAPELILDASESEASASEHWALWPSLPAVQHGRVVRVPTSVVTRPGPYLDRALGELARAIHTAATRAGDERGAP
ncbi:MAG: helical backbone metal receptor [Myxococcales bacterium]|nr:helical backbone metal receptor [Myxococcales bacterium]MDH5567567.1 helical backbone metal receptor [Myxococcales bacterium]